MVTSTSLLQTVLPNQPASVAISSSQAASIDLYWDPPIVTSFQILYYIISAHNLNKTNSVDVIISNITTSTTSFDVTGLLPGTTYELTVVAVYGKGNPPIKSQANNSVIASTGFTG